MPDQLPPPGPERDEITALFVGGPSDGRVVPVGSFLAWRAIAADASVWTYCYRGRQEGELFVFELDDEDAARWPWYEVALLADRGDLGERARRRVEDRERARRGAA